MKVHRRIIAVVILTALGPIGLVVPSNAVINRPAHSYDGWIAFRRYDPEAETQRLWVSKLDGSKARPLTTDFGGYVPDWSPDRSTIVFDYPVIGHEQIAIIHPDGTGFTQLTQIGDSGAPGFSPDGQHILFDHHSPGQPANDNSLWVMNADGSDPHPLLKTATSADAFPRYSPDGSRIAFLRFVTVAGIEQTAVFVANADGTNPRQITPYQADLLYPRWSPDSMWITYGVDPWQGDLSKAGVWLVKPSGRHRHNVYPAGRFYGFLPDFSPDGTQLLFRCEVRADQQSDLCTINVDGSGLHRTVRTPDVFETEPAWS